MLKISSLISHTNHHKPPSLLLSCIDIRYIKTHIRKIHSYEKTVAKELHDARISAQLTLERVHDITRIPIHIIDRLELGIKQIDLPQLYMLAKAYNKKIQINLVNRNKDL